eukprot:TRINITY_DN12777_c0_g1_i3.p1 TRINITY_DN12777_c0_g1~~TRINITY_DN12777_c0_g1_i3.p1  ORF type:complete len:453 (+),score=97.05 TRINITY_DN12777_c0_g1_i3:31-1359(+)
MEEIELRLDVDPVDVGAIIGPKGATVNTIRKTFNVMIHCPSRETLASAGPAAQVIVRGFYEHVFQASRMIHSTVSLGVHSSTLEFIIQKWKIESLVGYRRTFLFQVQRQCSRGGTGIQVTLPAEGSGSSTVSITGNRLMVEKAYRMLWDNIRALYPPADPSAYQMSSLSTQMDDISLGSLPGGPQGFDQSGPVYHHNLVRPYQPIAPHQAPGAPASAGYHQTADGQQHQGGGRGRGRGRGRRDQAPGQAPSQPTGFSPAAHGGFPLAPQAPSAPAAPGATAGSPLAPKQADQQPNAKRAPRQKQQQQQPPAKQDSAPLDNVSDDESRPIVARRGKEQKPRQLRQPRAPRAEGQPASGSPAAPGSASTPVPVASSSPSPASPSPSAPAAGVSSPHAVSPSQQLGPRGPRKQNNNRQRTDSPAGTPSGQPGSPAPASPVTSAPK